MELRIVLDFDGVLFNSAFEAYTVCNKSTIKNPLYRQDVSFEEFLEFRSFVTDAWQYNRLYHIKNQIFTFKDLPDVNADYEDWSFSKNFFENRSVMMEDPEWPKLMSPYDFFFRIKPTLLLYPDKFVILSTRNIESIRRTMTFYGADVLSIFGQEDIRREGSKINVAKQQGWLTEGKYLIVYVDDMNAHLEPFEGKVHLPLHANWGYDRAGDGSLDQHQILAIIQSMLKLNKHN